MRSRGKNSGPCQYSLIGRVKHQAMNLVLQAYKDLGEGMALWDQGVLVRKQPPGMNAWRLARRPVTDVDSLSDIYKTEYIYIYIHSYTHTHIYIYLYGEKLKNNVIQKWWNF